MKPEYKIREVTRYVITKHTGNATHAMVEADSLKAANAILSALNEQAIQWDSMSGNSLEHSGMDPRWWRALRADGIETVEELQKLSFKELQKIPNIGLAGRLNIKLSMSQYGGLRDD